MGERKTAPPRSARAMWQSRCDLTMLFLKLRTAHKPRAAKQKPKTKQKITTIKPFVANNDYINRQTNKSSAMTSCHEMIPTSYLTLPSYKDLK